jgi:hypothetical protein
MHTCSDHALNVQVSDLMSNLSEVMTKAGLNALAGELKVCALHIQSTMCMHIYIYIHMHA